MTVVVRSDYGWTGAGKSSAEIASDIDHTRHRLAADVRALTATLLAPRWLVPIASIALSAASFLVRRMLRRRR